MVKMHALYQGEKHCEITHEPSRSQIETDAPKDNHGKGERFSPTDLVAAALSTCMLTVMAIAAEKDGISLKGATVDIEKEMAANPRRIISLKAVMKLPAGIPKERRSFLEAAAHSCPVKKSLHPDIQLPVEFIYAD